MAKAWVEDRWHKKKGTPTELCRQHKGAKRYRAKAHGIEAQWEVRGYDDQGKPLRKERHESYDDAEARAIELTTEITSGRHRQQQQGKILLRRYIEDVYWPSAEIPPGTRERTWQRISSSILPHLGDHELLDVGPEELNAWKAKLRESLGAGTIRTTWQNLSTILQAAHEAGRIPRNPCRGLTTARPPKRPPTNKTAWSQERFRDVRIALPDRYRMLANLGVGSGLRQGEALGWSPDDLRDGWLYVDRQLQGVGRQKWFKLPKRDKTRRVPVTPEFEKAVWEYCEEFPPVTVTLPWVNPSDPTMPMHKRPKVTVRLLTTTAYSNPISHTSWNLEIWKAALEEAGVVERLYREDGTPRDAFTEPGEHGFHVLRHTFASVHLGAGEAPTTVAEYMGDTVATVLRYYAHFIPDAGGRGLEAMGNFMSLAA
ncbi:tyrosine-type recombinase/integrase [Streptomyces sp. NPDC059443]|uniref:tyrosine-type recombinase/integrase n=1 Tax=unclassified Streptomyces TaxID=2593676 RepID=UPI0036752A08